MVNGNLVRCCLLCIEFCAGLLYHNFVPLGCSLIVHQTGYMIKCENLGWHINLYMDAGYPNSGSTLTGSTGWHFSSLLKRILLLSFLHLSVLFCCPYLPFDVFLLYILEKTVHCWLPCQKHTEISQLIPAETRGLSKQPESCTSVDDHSSNLLYITCVCGLIRERMPRGPRVVEMGNL